MSAGLITIASQFGGSQNIKVTSTTKFATQSTVTVADLKVGDQVQVQGAPTSITASSITAGDIPDFLQGGGPGRGGPGGLQQGGVQASTRAGQPGQQGGPGNQMQAFAMAAGKIESLNPLTIAISSDVSIVLKLAKDAKITKITSTTLNDLKVGDRIQASGQAAQDGTFNATGIGVNLSQGGFGPGGSGGPGGIGPGGPGGGGRGGFGGPGGPGGQGGPGGPGGPPPGDGPAGDAPVS
jgi:hypothetical protein